jgi:hypothetical protein
MTRPLSLFALLTVMGGTGSALADCPGDGYNTLLDNTALQAQIADQSIDANAPDGENWKEIHCGSGTIGDLEKVALGPGHPVDPQRKVGTWSIVDDTIDTMEYNYGSGGTYQWRIYRDTNGNAADQYCWQVNSNGGAVIATGNITAVGCLVP